MVCRLFYCVDHPIQYQAPLLRLIARQPDIDLQAVFKSPAGATAYFDSGFGKRLQWDTPLLEGYSSAVIDDDRQAGAAIRTADVVWLHGWQGARMLRLLNAAHRAGIPVLMRGENTQDAMPDGRGLRGMLKRRYLDWIFARSTAFLAVGSANRAYYLAHGIDPARLFDMPYAVDNGFFRAGNPAGGALRSHLKLEEGRPVVLFAGKFQARKNPMALLRAFQSLDGDRLNRPYLVFVGDGEQRGALEATAAGNGAVRFAGFLNQSEMRDAYRLANVFVLASSREPWGLAVNEAMNCQCAIVVSAECGCAADLIDAQCGRIVPPNDAAALATALDDILADRDRCRTMGQAASRRIEGWNFERDVAGLRAALSFARPERRPA
jgi:glycosyltransferase involved in cell wall biosynthesis